MSSRASHCSDGPDTPANDRLGRRLIRGIRHAFAIGADRPGLTDDDQHLLDMVARAVVRRRLAAPATMLLESVRPLHFIGSQALAFFEPMVSAVLDPAKCTRFRELMEQRETIPALLAAIEREEAAEGDR